MVPYDLWLDFYVQIEITIDSTPIFYEESKNGRCQIFWPWERGQIQDGRQGAAQFLIFAITSLNIYKPMITILVSNHMFSMERKPINAFIVKKNDYFNRNQRWRPRWLPIQNIWLKFFTFGAIEIILVSRHMF